MKKFINIILLSTTILTSTLLYSMEKFSTDQRPNTRFQSRSETRNLAFLHAAHLGDIEATKDLLNQKADINCQDDNGHTPLHFAAQKGCIEMVKLLLKQGAMVNCRDCNGNTPLHFAAQKGCIEIVNLLLRRGAMHKANRLHNSPYEVAIFYEHHEVASILEENWVNYISNLF